MKAGKERERKGIPFDARGELWGSGGHPNVLFPLIPPFVESTAEDRPTLSVGERECCRLLTCEGAGSWLQCTSKNVETLHEPPVQHLTELSGSAVPSGLALHLKPRTQRSKRWAIIEHPFGMNEVAGEIRHCCPRPRSKLPAEIVLIWSLASERLALFSGLGFLFLAGALDLLFGGL